MFGTKEIEITIDAMGNPKVEAKGFKGAGCEAATKSIEEALAGGKGGVERVLKPEFLASGGNSQELHEKAW